MVTVMRVKYIKKGKIIRTVDMNFSGKIIEENEKSYIVDQLHNPDIDRTYEEFRVFKKDIIKHES